MSGGKRTDRRKHSDDFEVGYFLRPLVLNRNFNKYFHRIVFVHRFWGCSHAGLGPQNSVSEDLGQEILLVRVWDFVGFFGKWPE